MLKNPTYYGARPLRKRGGLVAPRLNVARATFPLLTPRAPLSLWARVPRNGGVFQQPARAARAPGGRFELVAAVDLDAKNSNRRAAAFRCGPPGHSRTASPPVHRA